MSLKVASASLLPPSLLPSLNSSFSFLSSFPFSSLSLSLSFEVYTGGPAVPRGQPVTMGADRKRQSNREVVRTGRHTVVRGTSSGLTTEEKITHYMY